jgi:hypothetical protein
MSVIQITVQFREDETHASQILVLDGVRVRLDTYTNKDDNSWYLDLFDEDDNPQIQGLALVAGLDLWFPYKYKSGVPPGILFVQDQSGQPFRDPIVSDFLDGNMALFYVTADQEFTEPAPIEATVVEIPPAP